MNKLVMEYITLICFTLTLSTAAGLSVTARVASKVVLVEGETTLRCEVTPTPTATNNINVYWATEHVIYNIPKDWWGGFGPGRKYSYSDYGQNLNIKNITADLHGDYRCFGSYLTAQSEPDSTLLIVYKAPERVSITGVSPVARDGRTRDVYTIPFNAPRAILECRVLNSSPEVAVKWYKQESNQQVLLSSEVTVLPAEIDPATSFKTSISRLTIENPGQDINGNIYSCQADLQPLISHGIDISLPDQIARLSVQFPPNNLIIEGYDNRTVAAGDTIRLTCKSSGGNPLPTLTWRKNGQEVLYHFNTEERSQTVSSVLMINTTKLDNNALYQCDATSVALGDSKLKSAVVLQVMFPPDTLTILGHQDLDAGSNTTLSCTSSPSNPAAKLNWDVGRKYIHNTVEETLKQDDGSFITQSNITISIEIGDDELRAFCAANIVGLPTNIKTESVRLSVNYPPSRVNITASSDILLMAGSARILSCSSYAGNPTPVLNWFYENEALGALSGVQDQISNSEGRQQAREFQFVAQPKHNRAKFKCVASSSVAGKWTDVTVEYSTAVFFPAQNVTVATFPDGSTLTEDVPATLKCVAGSANPEPEILWEKNSKAFFGSSISSPPAWNDLYNGVSKQSRITFTPTASDHGVYVKCTARNNAMEKSTTSGFQLNVQFKPIFGSGLPTVITVSEGKNHTANFTSLANPPATQYQWFKIAADSSETELTFAARRKRDDAIPEISVNAGLFILTNINRDKASRYKVKAINTVGSTEFSFTVDVQYAPGGLSVTQTRTGDELVLTCSVDSNPQPSNNNGVVFYRDGYEMTADKHTQSVIEPAVGHVFKWSLTIKSVVKNDIGTYTCFANNSLGESSTTHAVTPTPFAPEMIKDITKAAASTGADGTIICKMEAYPKPTIKWYKGDVLLQTDSKYNMPDASVVGSYLFTFNLIIKSVQEGDYGDYKCVVDNQQGAPGEHTVKLAGTSQPDPPSSLQLQNMTDTVLILTWAPGFDGGLKQYFRIKYFKADETPQNVKYADANTAPYSLTGLNPATKYTLSVRSHNDLGASKSESAAITVSTIATQTVKPFMQSDEDKATLIIMLALVVVGVLLFIVTIVLVVIFVRRRRRNKLSEATDSTSQSNTVEMYGTQDGDVFLDDRSYGTYEKGFDDDYKHYDDDDQKTATLKSKSSLKKPYQNDLSPANMSPRTEPTTQSNHTLPRQPWNKNEDPSGQSGTYNRKAEANQTADEQTYASQLRNISKTNLPQTYQRPAFAQGRPPAPPPPGRSAYSSTTVPDRNYSPYNITSHEQSAQHQQPYEQQYYQPKQPLQPAGYYNEGYPLHERRSYTDSSRSANSIEDNQTYLYNSMV